MQELTFDLPMLSRVLVMNIVTEDELAKGLIGATASEVIENPNGENLSLHLAKDGFIYGQLNAFDEDIDDIENWDEGFDNEKVLVPVTSFGYRFSSIADAYAFTSNVKIIFPYGSIPFGYVQLNPDEKTQFLKDKPTTLIAEQYDSRHDWQSVQLPDGRVLIINPHRDDKAHASLFNNLTEYLIEKRDYENFLDYIDKEDIT